LYEPCANLGLHGAQTLPKPCLSVALRAKGLRELSEIQRWTVIPALKQVPGVADVENFGGITTQFQLDLDPQQLASVARMSAHFCRKMGRSFRQPRACPSAPNKAARFQRRSGYPSFVRGRRRLYAAIGNASERRIVGIGQLRGVELVPGTESFGSGVRWTAPREHR
jgi:hypothetical protein